MRRRRRRDRQSETAARRQCARSVDRPTEVSRFSIRSTYRTVITTRAVRERARSCRGYDAPRDPDRPRVHRPNDRSWRSASPGDECRSGWQVLQAPWLRRHAVALRLDTVFRGRREVDDRIDPIGRDTEFERQIHIAAAERVDEGIDFASGCGSDPICDAFPISDWDHTVVSEPSMVCCAGETDDVSSAEILAHWTAMEPTPPAAPEMTTVSPAFNETACTAA
jgi:hypothetical protein